jgi:hypothetical protein
LIGDVDLEIEEFNRERDRMIEEIEAAEEAREEAAEAERLMRQEQERDRIKNERIRDTETINSWLRELDQ